MTHHKFYEIQIYRESLRWLHKIDRLFCNYRFLKWKRAFKHCFIT